MDDTFIDNITAGHHVFTGTVGAAVNWIPATSITNHSPAAPPTDEYSSKRVLQFLGLALMADAYNAPELVLWYCANECPLGRNCREVPEMPPERTFVRLTNILNKLTASMQELAELMDSGVEDEAERRKIPKLWDEFLEARRRIDETLAVLEKLQNQV
ncbi:MAG: hypothetical protein LUD83_06415 [Clostridiales bacterium]|nr:hypothetical protein [Clostridiales bacterium]